MLVSASIGAIELPNILFSLFQKRLFSVFTGGLISSGENEKRPRQQEASGKTFEVVTPPIVSSEGESEGAEEDSDC